MSYKIALAGNPNSGKTTLFNALTGSNQFVGNWPGVTVEKKEGKLNDYTDITLTDLPGIYSLSPYTPEEIVARDYLTDEKPDVILNIIDGTNLERNLYLTTQLTELGIPVVCAINMMDILRKNGDKIDIEKLSQRLGCEIVEISALKGSGIAEAAEAAINAAKAPRKNSIKHRFSGAVEHALAHIEELALHDMPQIQQSWYAVKLFERDKKAIEKLQLKQDIIDHIENDITACELELDDDSESIIIGERYDYVSKILDGCFKKKNRNTLSVSDKIDRVVTNRILALPIFAIIMFLVYYISVTTVGTYVTDWMNNGVFGEGWHLFGNGTAQYEEAVTDYAKENIWTEEVRLILENAVNSQVTGAEELLTAANEEDFAGFEEVYESYGASLAKSDFDISRTVDAALEAEDMPDTSNYGIWIPGIPVLAENLLNRVNCGEALKALILDGIIRGVGSVLGFVPQLLVLFIFLAFLEACGYMSRIAFIMDKIFRKFGLSGKSFIPILIGTGCGVPGIMASRTIENDRDRKMTIITTTFIPCGAKLPIIAMIAGALFNNAPWVAPSAYFVGIAAIVISGIILKKTKLFSGNPAPFVMELPAYHMPTFTNIMRSMWERGWSFIKKAGTVILLSSIIIWAGSRFGFGDGGIVFSSELSLEQSILGKIGSAICPIFTPLGFGNSKAAIATIMGLVAKEEIVGVFGVLDFSNMSKLAAYSFLVFNLLCAPCFAAMGAIKREMNNPKWTLFAIAYQCVFAYIISLCIYQIGNLFAGTPNSFGFFSAVAAAAILIYMLVRPSKNAQYKYIGA